jgi:hypothetical protein
MAIPVVEALFNMVLELIVVELVVAELVAVELSALRMVEVALAVVVDALVVALADIIQLATIRTAPTTLLAPP